MRRLPVIGAGPLQQPQGQFQIPIHPGPQGHGAARIVKTLASIPIKGIAVPLVAIAGQAGWHTVLRDAQPAQAAGAARGQWIRIEIRNRCRRAP